jgi:hypothetical protein
VRFVRGSICSLCNRAHGTQQADAEDEVLVRAIQTTQVIDIVGIVGMCESVGLVLAFLCLYLDRRGYALTHRCMFVRTGVDEDGRGNRTAGRQAVATCRVERTLWPRGPLTPAS